ncbi:MAG: hypothetical protein HY608_06750 [Planctomycetes bacterium]|nr:hypothetical protein [Planctomycetota bacterium]
MSDSSNPPCLVAIIGGAVSGAEAAKVFTERGIGAVVLEQNDRPYGKIEDGLPRWHDKQRPQEYKRIDERLSHPLVHFIPRTRIGRDVAFEDLVKNWGFSCVLLANGAWRDRPLGIEGVEAYLGKGFYYQNPFIYWFNHSSEKDFKGTRCEVAEGAIVVGGGLASLDVVKVLMLETIATALRARGIQEDVIHMEHEGPSATLRRHGLTLESLGVKPCTLYYRRRLQDMPLASYKDGADEASRRKTEETRAKLLNNAKESSLFRFQECVRPVDKIVEGGRLAGLRFLRTEMKGDKLVDVPDSTFDVRAPLTISSVGSIPEPVAGIPMKGELYVWRDREHGELDFGVGVYGVGNVVTGKGNIAVSRKHGQFIADHVAQAYLGLAKLPAGTSLLEGVAGESAEKARKIADEIPRRSARLSSAAYDAALAKVRARQKAVGYVDYASWMQKVVPADLR